MIHNHPNSSPFSSNDYNTALKYKSCFEAIACGHNGDVFCFRGVYGTRGAESEELGCEALREFRIGFTKYKRLYPNEFEARHKAWQSTAMNRGFYYEKI